MMEDLLRSVVAASRARTAAAEAAAGREAREAIEGAEAHVEALVRAARNLGRVRGRAVDASATTEAEREVRALLDGARGRLRERFLARVVLAVGALPGTPRYARALATWAGEARALMEAPTEVFAAPRDREAVYDALLAAGAEDFRVLADRRIACGFVVRDADGRTVIDRRPEAVVEAHAERLGALLGEVHAVLPEPALVPDAAGG
jgi:vacuolar-type H+-ATPase subunit E/Vma4